jgi:hypothetical protein
MRRTIISLGIALAVALTWTTVWAGSDVVIGSRVPEKRRVSIEKIDHSEWDALLHKYCDAKGMVGYAAWHRDKSDRRRLTAYLAQLSRADPNRKSAQAATMAFWINAYNAVTIHGILREYPTTSIRNHTAKVFGYNIWTDLLLPVGDKNYSLDQMEHDVLRKMGDPRIHFAIVCASIGCPPLSNSAYLPTKLDSQLTANAKRFFADGQKFQHDSSNKTIRLSPILKWFREDFGTSQKALLRTIAPFLPDESAQALATGGKASVSYLEYDWGLNDQAAGSGD